MTVPHAFLLYFLDIRLNHELIRLEFYCVLMISVFRCVKASLTQNCSWYFFTLFTTVSDFTIFERMVTFFLDILLYKSIEL